MDVVRKLEPLFYARPVVEVAQDLIGCYLVRDLPEGRIIGRINEVEAYEGATDKASHAWGDRRTVRNEPMYCAGGIAHVYFVYGMHHCLNFVTGPQDEASAVLIRGLEIVSGHELVAQNRYGRGYNELTKMQRRNMTNGPAKLCQALQIGLDFDYEPLNGERLFAASQIACWQREAGEITASKRIGIDYAEEAVDFLWRFTG